jgi:anti-sigma B factor antagonist
MPAMPEQSPRLTVSIEPGNITVVQLADRKILDEISITQIGEQLKSLVAQSKPPRVVLDFSNVAHMSSSALGMLISLNKRIREESGQLRLCCIQPTIHEVFVITRLTEIFEIRRTREEALTSMR